MILTADGSSTLLIPEWNESYHSRHGAIQEAYHVFIENAWKEVLLQDEIHVLEIGLGSGLNALITLLESQSLTKKVYYNGIEKYPLPSNEFRLMNYSEELSKTSFFSEYSSSEIQEHYLNIMQADWESFQSISPKFFIRKIKEDFLAFDYPLEKFHLVYFDAFGYRVQPDLWTVELFDKIYKSLKIGGILSTYSAKGSVRRGLIEVGFKVEKRPGPPGKREMLVARK